MKNNLSKYILGVFTSTLLLTAFGSINSTNENNTIFYEEIKDDNYSDDVHPEYRELNYTYVPETDIGVIELYYKPANGVDEQHEYIADIYMDVEIYPIYSAENVSPVYINYDEDIIIYQVLISNISTLYDWVRDEGEAQYQVNFYQFFSDIDGFFYSTIVHTSSKNPFTITQTSLLTNTYVNFNSNNTIDIYWEYDQGYLEQENDAYKIKITDTEGNDYSTNISEIVNVDENTKMITVSNLPENKDFEYEITYIEPTTTYDRNYDYSIFRNHTIIGTFSTKDNSIYNSRIYKNEEDNNLNIMFEIYGEEEINLQDISLTFYKNTLVYDEIDYEISQKDNNTYNIEITNWSDLTIEDYANYYLEININSNNFNYEYTTRTLQGLEIEWLYNNNDEKTLISSNLSSSSLGLIIGLTIVVVLTPIIWLFAFTYINTKSLKIHETWNKKEGWWISK